MLPRYTAIAASLASALLSVQAAPASAQDFDIEAVFRCAATDEAGQANCLEARATILNNCTTCHTFVPIVMQQFDAGSWQSLLDRHVGGGRVDQLSKDEVDRLREYLIANFNPDQPQPDLPPALLETWTSY